MNRLRRWSVLALVLLTPALRGQDKPAPEWSADRSLTVSPQPAPGPSLKYRLLPPSWELKEGNAVPIYLRLVHEQSEAAQKYWAQTPVPWNRVPVDKMPSEQVLAFLRRMANPLRQFDLGARRKTAEWDYTIDQGNPLDLLLPDAQIMRTYAPMLMLQVRAALAKGDFDAAVHHLQTCFAVSRHVTEGPTYINGMVAIALASQFTNTVADFVEQPDAPNLYWALAALPRPLLDLRRESDFEYQMLERVFPDLDHLDRERTPAQWDALLRYVRTSIYGLAMEGDPPRRPDYFPKDLSADQPAANSRELPAAREYVARARGLSADRVAAMPAAQVLLQFLVGRYHEERDFLFRSLVLPIPERLSMLEKAVRREREAPTSEAELLPHILLPAVNKPVSFQVGIERHLAALQVVEALRLHAAAHDGKLPEKLDDVTEVPVPQDPATGKPFTYRHDGDAVTVEAAPDGLVKGVRYRVSVRKR